jgi:ribosomal protein S18 acetylase RimI-like enzyme
VADDSSILRSVVIRAAEARDIAAVLALDQATPHLPHWSYTDYEAALHSAQTQNETSAPAVRRCLIVAESAGAIAGFAVGSAKVIEDEAFAELESVAVAEVFRGVGIGRALCAAVITWARDRGALSLELEVRSRSSVPIALYTSLGFTRSGRRAAYYRDPADDALLMRLELIQAIRGS